MAKSRSWSNASAPCRLEWRPSPRLAAMYLGLGWLAGVAALTSEMPAYGSIPLAVSAAGHGIWLAQRELRRPIRQLVIPASAVAATIDGQDVSHLQVHWRGSLAFLRWRGADGRRDALWGWPDNLDAAARRELRLAMAARTPARSPR